MRFVCGHHLKARAAVPAHQRYTPKPETGCWEWNGALHGGYGVVRRDGRTLRAHRVMYEQCKGAIPHGLQLDHLCRNRACVNPDHLEPVTNKENSRRGIQPKLTMQKAAEIRTKYAETKTSTYKLAKEYGVSAQQIFRVVRGIDWQ